MKIQYCSDLHLEFVENNNFINQNPIKPIADILILAGDIIPFGLIDKRKEFFDYVSANFKTTYWLPGNHEYYNCDASKRSGTFQEQIRSNVFLVNNLAIETENIRFIFSTLWSKIGIQNAWQIERSMNDFRVIDFNKKRLSISQYNQWHEEGLSFLKAELQRTDAAKTIIITHHVPTLFNYPPVYKNSELNEAFAVELFDFIEPSNIDYWIYGHNHFNVPNFEIGTTKMLTNQLGYVHSNENQLYDSSKFILV